MENSPSNNNNNINNSSAANRLAPLASLDITTSSNGLNGGSNAVEQAASLHEQQRQIPASQQQPTSGSAGRSPADLALMNSSPVALQQQSRFQSGDAAVPQGSDALDIRSVPQHQQQQPGHQLVDGGGAYAMTAGGGSVGRMSPPCYPGSTYATLTPLQPLPPISTVSDKFNGNGGANMGFVFMHHPGTTDITQYNAPSDVYSSYKYEEKEPNRGEMAVSGGSDHAVSCTGFEPSENGLIMNGAGYNMPQQQQQQQQQPQQQQVRGIPTQYAMYGHAPTNDIRQTSGIKSEMVVNNVSLGASVDSSMLPYENIAIYASNLMSPQQQPAVSLSPMKNMGGASAVSLCQVPNGSLVSSLMTHRVPSGFDPRCLPAAQQQQQQMRVGSPDQPSSSTDMHGCDDGSSTQADGGGEEINTRDVAVRVSNELKKYSIPQAVFAQRVLGRSQGTLSDLLRNPKPWSKLKSGRETFRRMWKWLQEPEYQRMAALRISGPGSYTTPDSMASVAAPVKQPPLPCNKRNRDGSMVSPSSSGTTQQHHQLQQQQPPPQQQQQQQQQQQHRAQPDSQAGNGGNSGGQQSGACPTKKPRMVFTEIQRRTLVAIFKEIKRPSKEIQATIAEQLGLKVSTVVNFFMNARRRSVDKYMDETSPSGGADRDVINSAAVSSTAGPADDVSLRQ